MHYIDHHCYRTLGGRLELAAFNRCINRVCALIDGATFNRVKKMAEEFTAEELSIARAEWETAMAEWEENIKTIPELPKPAEPTESIVENKVLKRLPTEVKALCRELVDYLDACSAPVVTSRSQSSGGVSESESYATKSREEQSQDIENMICDYLLSVNDNKGTPLLYRGCV